MKYEIIKIFPGCYKEIGDHVIDIFWIGKDFIYCSNWPEFFKPIEKEQFDLFSKLGEYFDPNCRC